MALTWTKNIMAVNRENRRASNVRKTNIIRFSGEGRPDLFINGHVKCGTVSGDERINLVNKFSQISEES